MPAVTASRPGLAPRHTLTTLICVLTLAPGLVLAGERVYRCTDRDGKVAFQGQPCPGALPPATTAAVATAAPRATVPPQATVPAASLPLHSLDYEQTTRANALSPPLPGMKQWAADADVVVVSGYAPSARLTQVDIDHRARPVLVVLSAYESTMWKVVPAPGTRIKAIVVSSRESTPRYDVQAPAGVPVQFDRLPYADEAENINFRELMKQLNARYGVERVLALRGGHKLPAQVAVRGPFAPDPLLTFAGVRPQVPAVRFGFDLVSVDGRRLPFTNTGPADGKRYTGIVRGGMLSFHGSGAAAVGEDGREAYYLEGNGSTLVWAPEGMSGRKEKLTLPPHLPPLSWGAGLAWDTRKGVLAIASFGGEGHFYRYDTRRHQWLDARSLQRRNLMSLSFDASSGGYVGVSRSLELVRFNARGELEDVQSLEGLLPDVDSTYDKGNRRPDGLSAFAHGAATAVVSVVDGTVSHIWTYDARARKAQLSYKAEPSSWPVR